jgi:hypothetical protein
MFKKLLTSVILLLVLSFSVFAQKKIVVDKDITPPFRNCYAMENLQRLKAEDPTLEFRMRNIENFIQAQVKKGSYEINVTGVITIPVNIIVVYSNATQNISDAQIQSQIDVLNADFRKANHDWNKTSSAFINLVADFEIQFSWVRTERHSDATTSWGTNDAVKTAYPPYSPTTHLNFWVANIGGGILGYAQFPGGPSSTDGVVISPQYFGTNVDPTTGGVYSGSGSFYLSDPFDEGRTATHEVGHWVNLYHIWGDDGTGCSGSDQVSDTPNQGGSTSGCPGAGTIRLSCSNGPNGDMWMNYMDYTDDACMYMFSAGQKTRARAIFEPGGPRESFVGPVTPTVTVTAPNGGESWTVNTTQNITWTSTGTIANVMIEYSSNGGTNWSTVIASTANDGTHAWTVPSTTTTQGRIRVSDASNAATNDMSNANFSIVAAGSYITSESEPNDASSSADSPVGSNVAVSGSISTSTDNDWFSFTTGSTGTISVSLSIATSADLDWFLYNSSLTEVARGYTTANPETGSYASAPAGTYYLKVNGYSGATSGYTLTVTYPGTVSNSVTVTAPNGGENWTVGSSKNITWTSTGSIANVKLEYSTNGGTSWALIISSTANDGTHAWTVPNTPTTTAKVRVSDAANAATNDVSNANFTISSAPTTVTIFSEGFEVNNVPGGPWTASDANSSAGSDYWGTQSSSSGARVHGGTRSSYCAQNSDIAGQKYDNYMSAYMTHNTGVNISGYTNVQISFWIWYDTENSYDYVSFQYYKPSTGSWVQFTNGKFTGTGTTWAQKTFTVPAEAGTTFKFRWRFYSDYSVTKEGAYIDDIAVTGSSAKMAAAEQQLLPKEFALSQNYPNPFNPTTAISFDLPKDEHVVLNIYNINGQLVRTLVNEKKNAGSYKVIWNGLNESGKAVASGMYIYRIKAGSFMQTKRMTLMK